MCMHTTLLHACMRASRHVRTVRRAHAHAHIHTRMQVVSSTLAGAALGSLTGGNLADALGRRTAFLLCCLPLLAGPLLCAWAGSFAQLGAGRFVTGVAIGLSSALVSTYISEVGVRTPCYCCSVGCARVSQQAGERVSGWVRMQGERCVCAC